MKGEAKEPVTAGLKLSKGSLLRVEGIDEGAEVLCFSGTVWITQEDRLGDCFLDAGEKFVIDQGGLVIVQALEDARLGIEEANSPLLLNLTLIQRKFRNGLLQ